MTKSNTGVVTSSTRVEDDKGRIVLRVIVDFYDGSAPDINVGTIWLARPVTVIDSSLNGEASKIPLGGRGEV